MINCIYICFKWSRTCEVQTQHTFTFIIRLFFFFFFLIKYFGRCSGNWVLTLRAFVWMWKYLNPFFFFPSVSQNTDVTPEVLNHMLSPGKTNPGENLMKHDVHCDEFCLQKLRKLQRNNLKLPLIPVSALQYLKLGFSNYNKRKQLIFSAEQRRNSRAPVWRVSSFSDGAD